MVCRIQTIFCVHLNINKSPAQAAVAAISKISSAPVCLTNACLTLIIYRFFFLQITILINNLKYKLLHMLNIQIGSFCETTEPDSTTLSIDKCASSSVSCSAGFPEIYSPRAELFTRNEGVESGLFYY